MDKIRLNNEEKLKLCKFYYRVGFLALPAIWALNYFWFHDEACNQSEFAEQKEIQKFRNRSGFGAFIWLILITVWVIIFQLNRVKWGEFGDDISFVIPTGSL